MTLQTWALTTGARTIQKLLDWSLQIRVRDSPEKAYPFQDERRRIPSVPETACSGLLVRAKAMIEDVRQHQKSHILQNEMLDDTYLGG